MAAPGGVIFTGTGLMGDGEGAIYGQFTNTGTWPDGDPGANSWASFDPTSASVTGGGGGGGAGGAGQLLPSGNGVNVSAIEGVTFSATVADFTDPAPPNPASYTATIAWGDGSQSTASTTDGSITPDGNGGWNVNGTHAYAEPGSYTITTTLTPAGDPNSAATTTSTATVAEGALSATVYGIQATVNQTWTGVIATFTDQEPNTPASDYTAVAHWMNNAAAVPCQIQPDPNGGFDILMSYAFPQAGSWNGYITLSDDGQTVYVPNLTASVSDGGGGSSSMSASPARTTAAPPAALATSTFFAIPDPMAALPGTEAPAAAPAAETASDPSPPAVSAPEAVPALPADAFDPVASYLAALAASDAAAGPLAAPLSGPDGYFAALS